MRAPSAADGEAIDTVGGLIAASATTSKAVEVTRGRSLLVATDSVLLPTGPFVRPRSVSCSSSPGFTNALENSPQSETPFSGRVQLPTSALRVTSRTVPLCQPSATVPAGRVTVSSLPASAERPPVADTVNAIT